MAKYWNMCVSEGQDDWADQTVNSATLLLDDKTIDVLISAIEFVQSLKGSSMGVRTVSFKPDGLVAPEWSAEYFDEAGGASWVSDAAVIGPENLVNVRYSALHASADEVWWEGMEKYSGRTCVSTRLSLKDLRELRAELISV